MKLTALIIEDEKNICDFISTTLSAQDYKTVTAYSGTEGLSLFTSIQPDIVLLDLGLPDLDGIQLIKKVREWSSTPIIVISARTQEKDKVLALDTGADDYIVKPFGSRELFARMRTALRHSNRLNTTSALYNRPYHAGDLTIDFERHLVTLRGKEIHLTQVEFKIVALLARNSGKVMTYDAIMSEIWGPYTDTNNRILRVNMANIRRKMEENPGEPVYIMTEIGIGYRMLEDDTSC
ncbi:MAG: response regulator transcription factor [Lachnospiraceae bacterium]|nr:response regulator transcription factor [Lachnospiraceae bacterium]